MRTSPEAASRLIAALYFWLLPLVGLSCYSVVGTFLSDSYQPQSGYRIWVPLLVVGSASTANALAYFVGLLFGPRIDCRHRIRLYLLSALLGLACFVTILLWSPVMGALRSLDEIFFFLLLLGPSLTSAFVAFVGLHASVALGLLRRHRDPETCSKCGYGLHGLPSSQCPECGHVAHPSTDT